MNIDLNSLKPLVTKVDAWIDCYIATHRNSRMRVSDLGFPNLPAYFAPRILDNSYTVYTNDIQAPPLAEFGIDGLSFFESLNANGITYKDTFFLTTDQTRRESIHFHELIHIIQWSELWAEDFIMVYGVNLLEYGYRQHPLEVIAYDLTERFDQGLPIKDLESMVRSHARDLANQLST